MSLTKPPIPASALPEGWIEACREAMRHHEGVPVRANPTMAAVDAYSISRRAWCPIMLPGGGFTFTSNEERDGVLRKLEGA